MTKAPIWQLDAFASDLPFSGNPAAVVLLERWLPDEILSGIALENQLSETAFLAPKKHPEGEADYRLRWFTPKAEVDLCGHATMAAGAVFLDKLQPKSGRAVFETRSGLLAVSRAPSEEDEGGDHYIIDLPALDLVPHLRAPAGLEEALGVPVVSVWRGMDLMAELSSPELISQIRPDFRALADMNETRGIVVTAAFDPELWPEMAHEYACRFFAPAFGIDEDPVTGSAHAALAPFWARRLDTKVLRAIQYSNRGGELVCRVEDDRVKMEGRVVPYLEGQIVVPS